MICTASALQKLFHLHQKSIFTAGPWVCFKVKDNSVKYYWFEKHKVKFQRVLAFVEMYPEKVNGEMTLKFAYKYSRREIGVDS